MKHHDPFREHVIQKTGNWMIYEKSNNWFDVDLSSSIYSETLAYDDLP